MEVAVRGAAGWAYVGPVKVTLASKNNSTTVTVIPRSLLSCTCDILKLLGILEVIYLLNIVNDVQRNTPFLSKLE